MTQPPVDVSPEARRARLAASLVHSGYAPDDPPPAEVLRGVARVFSEAWREDANRRHRARAASQNPSRRDRTAGH